MKLPEGFTVHENKSNPDSGTVIICNNDQGWAVNPDDDMDVGNGVNLINNGFGWDVKTCNYCIGKEITVTTGINHKELLKKYIAHVVSCEGTDFMSNIEYGDSDMKFTDEEFKELERLS